MPTCCATRPACAWAVLDACRRRWQYDSVVLWADGEEPDETDAVARTVASLLQSLVGSNLDWFFVSVAQGHEFSASFVEGWSAILGQAEQWVSRAFIGVAYTHASNFAMNQLCADKGILLWAS